MREASRGSGRDVFWLDDAGRDALHTVMFDNNIRPISMWSREVGGTERGPSGGVGVGGWRGGTWSGVISEANSLNNWEAELRRDGFLLRVNPFSEKEEEEEGRPLPRNALVRSQSPQVNSSHTAMHACKGRSQEPEPPEGPAGGEGRGPI